MSQIHCGNCGGKIKLPAGFSKAKIRCGLCGYYAEVPPDLRSAAPPDDTPPPPPSPPQKKTTAAGDRPRTVVRPVAADDDTPPTTASPARARPRTNPRDTRPEFAPEAGVGPPLLEGNQDEDDASPYGVEGDGLKRCPECQGELPHDAAFCVHCGTHLDGSSGPRPRRPKKKRTYTEIDESFGEGFPLPPRIALMGGVLVLNVVLTIGAVVAVAEDGKVDAVGAVTGMITFFVNSALQAFIIGSFDTLRVMRNEKGKATLLRLRRIAFFPLPPETIDWKRCIGVGRLATHAGSIIDWLTCLYLLGSGCLPGILFWWFVLKPERYHVVLCNLYGGVEETVFRGKDQKEAEKIADLVSEATTLQVRGVL